jgi:hypothetical protein
VTVLAVPERIESGNPFMVKHASISPSEAADRLAIRELIEAYASNRQICVPVADTHIGTGMRLFL